MPTNFYLKHWKQRDILGSSAVDWGNIEMDFNEIVFEDLECIQLAQDGVE
jgi:hypothetical protein